MQNYLPILGAVALPNVGGIVGGIMMRDSIKNWYPTLKTPSWKPPSWAFGPVWTGIYCSIGYGSYLAYMHGGGFNGPARLPLLAYGANLALNWAWSPIFFNLKRLDLALYEIILLDISTVTTGYLFYQLNKTAGWLFAPYCIWLSLATALTYRIYKDNPQKTRPKITEVRDD